MIKIIKLTLAMRYFPFFFTSVTFLFSMNLGLLDNFISLNDLLRENRVYYFKENKAPVNGPVKTFWSNGYVENTGTLLNGLKEEDWEYTTKLLAIIYKKKDGILIEGLMT